MHPSWPEQIVKLHAPADAAEGLEVLIRPIRPDDEARMARFHATLSERSVYFRYFHTLPLDTRIDPERLRRICFIEEDREMVLVAERLDAGTGEREILSVARLSRSKEGSEVEFAILTSDKFQGHGLGTELLHGLVAIARAEGFNRLTADILGENRQMMDVCRQLGFQLQYAGEGVVKATLDLLL